MAYRKNVNKSRGLMLFLSALLLVPAAASFGNPHKTGRSPRESHPYNKSYYGRFQGSIDPSHTGSVVVSVHSAKMGSNTFLKARFVLFKSTLVSNIALDVYGWENPGGRAELFTDKMAVLEMIPPSDRLGALRFFGFSSAKRIVGHHNPLFCNYDLKMTFDQKAIHFLGDKDILFTGNSEVIGECNAGYPNVHLTTSSNSYDRFAVRANRYIIAMVLINCLQMALMYLQVKFSSTAARSSKLCFYTFMLLGVYDSFIIMIHVLLTVTYESLFLAVTVLVITQFVIFSVFDMKFAIMLVTSGMDSEEITEVEVMRTRLGRLYLKFCLVLFLTTTVVYSDKIDFFSFFFCSFWVPQIVFNVAKGVNKMFRTDFIIGITICKLAFIIYYYGAREFNLFKGQNGGNYVLLFLLSTLLLSQAAVLVAMDKLGAHFFIPPKWRPKKYSYFRQIPQSDIEANKNPSCVICMVPVRSSAKDDVMVTPCDHSFHTECLSSWMEHQLKCPICRTELPSELG